LGSTLTFWQVVCGGTILAGVAVALNPGQHPHLDREDRWAGILFASLAAVGQALGAVLSRIGYEHARRVGQNIDGITAAYQRIVGGVLIVAVVALAQRRRVKDWRDSGQAGKHIWLWVLVNALAGPTL